MFLKWYVGFFNSHLLNPIYHILLCNIVLCKRKLAHLSCCVATYCVSASSVMSFVLRANLPCLVCLSWYCGYTHKVCMFLTFHTLLASPSGRPCLFNLLQSVVLLPWIYNKSFAALMYSQKKFTLKYMFYLMGHNRLNCFIFVWPCRLLFSLY